MLQWLRKHRTELGVALPSASISVQSLYHLNNQEIGCQPGSSMTTRPSSPLRRAGRVFAAMIESYHCPIFFEADSETASAYVADHKW